MKLISCTLTLEVVLKFPLSCFFALLASVFTRLARRRNPYAFLAAQKPRQKQLKNQVGGKFKQPLIVFLVRSGAVSCDH